MTAKYDHLNPTALKQLIGQGALLRPFSPEIMDAAYKATQETCGRGGREDPALQDHLRQRARLPQ